MLAGVFCRLTVREQTRRGTQRKFLKHFLEVDTQLIVTDDVHFEKIIRS